MEEPLIDSKICYWVLLIGNSMYQDWRSEAFGISHDDGDGFIEVFDSFEYLVFEHSGEFMLDGSQQCHQIKRIDFEISSEVRIEFDILHVQNFKLSHASEDSGFDLGQVIATSFLSRVGRSNRWASKLGISCPALARLTLL